MKSAVRFRRTRKDKIWSFDNCLHHNATQICGKWYLSWNDHLLWCSWKIAGIRLNWLSTHLTIEYRGFTVDHDTSWQVRKRRTAFLDERMGLGWDISISREQEKSGCYITLHGDECGVCITLRRAWFCHYYITSNRTAILQQKLSGWTMLSWRYET